MKVPGALLVAMEPFIAALPCPVDTHPTAETIFFDGEEEFM
jgi:hypothetical protein